MTCCRKLGPYDCCSVVQGDCLELMKALPDGCVDAVITDPPWPNSTPQIEGWDKPEPLLRDCAFEWPRLTKRACVCLGCASDPRILRAVPNVLGFFRLCWFDYARPGYQGRLLQGSEIAYLFGSPPKVSDGHFLIPGRYLDPSSDGKQANHPCPRKLGWMRWLIDKWTAENETVLDPFLGSGSTAVAAKKLGRHFLGFEISEEYCRIARERVSLVEAQHNLFEKLPTTADLFEDVKQ